MKHKIIRSASPFFDEGSIQAILKETEPVLRSGVLTDGPQAVEFEAEFAHFCGTKHAVAVNSGTAALEIVLRHFGVSGKEVIVPTNTFVATPNAVIFAGGKPVFADIHPDTLCIDHQDVEKKLTPKTAGVIVVHIAGLPCPQMPQLKRLCKDRGLFLLEDAAHAHGAMLDGKKAGALSDAGCFSFYPTKVMTSGEGGMIVTDDAELAAQARCMRSHGQNSSRQMVRLGYNWRLNEVAAVIGKHQLRQLETFVKKRNAIAQSYNRLLKDTVGVSLFPVPANIRHSYYKYPLKLDSQIDAAKIGSALKEQYGVETGNIYYPPCHLHPFYRENFGTKEGDLPVSEAVLKSVLCLPMHPAVTEENTAYVAEALTACLSEMGVS
jgi:perosamine synthetase